jgi:hypothetical protein
VGKHLTPERHAARLARDRAYSAAYYAAHHDAVRDRQARYRAAHPEYCREQAREHNRKWRDAHPYEVFEQHQRELMARHGAAAAAMGLGKL